MSSTNTSFNCYSPPQFGGLRKLMKRYFSRKHKIEVDNPPPPPPKDLPRIPTYDVTIRSRLIDDNLRKIDRSRLKNPSDDYYDAKKKDIFVFHHVEYDQNGRRIGVTPRVSTSDERTVATPLIKTYSEAPGKQFKAITDFLTSSSTGYPLLRKSNQKVQHRTSVYPDGTHVPVQRKSIEIGHS
jgi:hypothetical protein